MIRSDSCADCFQRLCRLRPVTISPQTARCRRASAHAACCSLAQREPTATGRVGQRGLAATELGVRSSWGSLPKAAGFGQDE